jgi:flavin reductase (DIM6/NTAB) family NADH-FMN oxidoreductase RutF
MKNKISNMKSSLQPVPMVIVSCRDTEGRNNALSVGYCCNCSYDPPMIMIGIVPSRFSYHMIKDTGCFVVNLVGEKQREMFNYLGSHSGRNEDKLAKLGVSIADGDKVNAPLLMDCPVNIECTVVDSIVTGSHEMFVGRVEAVHADSELLDGKGEIDFEKINFI